MFDRQELLILAGALNELSIKGSDAMYIATLISKTNGEINKIDEEAIKKEEEKQKLIEKDNTKEK